MRYPARASARVIYLGIGDTFCDRRECRLPAASARHLGKTVECAECVRDSVHRYHAQPTQSTGKPTR